MIIAIFLLFSMLPFLPALAVDVIYIPVIRILAPLLAAIWLIKGLIDKKVILPFSLPAIYLVSFLLFSGFSILWSENPLLGIRKLVLWISIEPVYECPKAGFLTTELRSPKITKMKPGILPEEKTVRLLFCL